MKQMDDNIGYVLKKLEDMGQLDNTIIVFTTDNGAEAITFPDGGVTPFKGQKGEAWEGGYRAPLVVRWPGHIKPGTVKNQMFAALDWLPTLVDIAGGAKGDDLKKQIEAGAYPGIVKTTLDGFDQRDYLEGKSEKSARDVFFYISGSTPSAVRYKNWKMYYTMSQPGADGWILPLVPFHLTLVQNIKRDPFEQAVGESQKTVLGFGGALAGPVTAYPLRLEHAAHRPATLGERTLFIQGVPAVAGAGDLQSHGNSGRDEKRRPPERLTVASNRRAPHHSAPAFREWRRLKPAADPQAIIGQTAVFDANASVGKMLDRGHHAPVLVKAMAHRSRFVERPIAAHGIMAGRNIAPGLAVVDRLAERAFDEDILIELKSPSEAGIKVAGLAVEIDRAAEMGARDQYVPHLSGENIQLCEQGFGVEIDRAFLGTERVMRISAEPKLVRKEVGA